MYKVMTATDLSLEYTLNNVVKGEIKWVYYNSYTHQHTIIYETEN